MSYDIISLRKDGEYIRYSTASSCPACGLPEGKGEIATPETVFNHIDGVYIMTTFWDESVYFDTEDKKLMAWDLNEEYPEEVTQDDKEYYYLQEIEDRLRNLFNDYWPTLGEIWEAINKED